MDLTPLKFDPTLVSYAFIKDLTERLQLNASNRAVKQSSIPLNTAALYAGKQLSK